MAQVRRIKTPESLDAIDAEHIEETLASPGWYWIKFALEEARDVKMRDLVRPHTEVETATLRGSIEALNRAIELPQALMAEARKPRPK